MFSTLRLACFFSRVTSAFAPRSCAHGFTSTTDRVEHYLRELGPSEELGNLDCLLVRDNRSSRVRRETRAAGGRRARRNRAGAAERFAPGTSTPPPGGNATLRAPHRRRRLAQTLPRLRHDQPRALPRTHTAPPSPTATPASTDKRREAASPYRRTDVGQSGQAAIKHILAGTESHETQP